MCSPRYVLEGVPAPADVDTLMPGRSTFLRGDGAWALPPEPVDHGCAGCGARRWEVRDGVTACAYCGGQRG